MISLTLFGLLLSLMALGVPVAIALGASTAFTLVFLTDFDPVAISALMFESLDKYALMAIPMFILAGNLLSKGSAAQRIVNLASSLVGHLPGGLPLSAIMASVIFAAVSGSSPATVVAVGSIMYGAISDAGYPKSYAIGTIATSGTLGILIPPSIVMIIYGVTADVSIGKLFMAGIIPGLMIASMLLLVTYVGAKRLGFKRAQAQTFKQRLIALKEASWALLTIVFIIGGIYAGIFTPTEAASVAVVWALFIAIYIYKDIGWSEVEEVLFSSAKTSAMILFIIANAMIFSFLLTIENIPQDLTSYLLESGVTPIIFLLMVNVILFFAGDFMEPSSVIMVLVPLLLPVALTLGINPIHFGVVVVVNMELGMITPPIGLNLFVASSISGLSLKDVMIASLPWSLTILVGLILVTYIPQISLFLPEFLY